MIILNLASNFNESPIFISFLFVINTVVITIATYNLLFVKRKIKRTREELLKSIDEDRGTLSKELHDVVGAFLVPVKAETENMEGEKRDKWEEHIDTFRKFIKQTSHTIYPEYIYNGNLYDALNKLSEFMSTDSTKINVHVMNTDKISEERGAQCFKVVLELLTNIMKHDKPERIVIASFTESRKLHFTINYNTESNEQHRIKSKPRSMGLRIIKQRLLYLRGIIKRTYNEGDNQIKLTIPLSK